MNINKLDKLFDSPDIFFKDHLKRDIYLRRSDAIDVINRCHIHNCQVLNVLPGIMDAENFEPSNDYRQPVCIKNVNSEQDWKSNRDAANIVKTSKKCFNTFIITAE